MSGWGPVQVSSHTPWWDYWTHGWGSQQLDTCNPRHWLRQNPGHRYSQSPWKPERTALYQLRCPENYVIPLATNVPKRPLYADGPCTQEEKGRLGQDIDWWTLGTRGDGR